MRASYVVTWPSTDSYQTESVIGDNPILNEISFDSGQGFGLDIEYKATPKWGIALLTTFTDIEGTFIAGLEPAELEALRVSLIALDREVQHLFGGDVPSDPEAQPERTSP